MKYIKPEVAIRNLEYCLNTMDKDEQLQRISSYVQSIIDDAEGQFKRSNEISICLRELQQKLLPYSRTIDDTIINEIRSHHRRNLEVIATANFDEEQIERAFKALDPLLIERTKVARETMRPNCHESNKQYLWQIVEYLNSQIKIVLSL